MGVAAAAVSKAQSVPYELVARGGEMKADMDASGTITLRPESPLEAFALRQWAAGYFSTVELRREGPALIIDTSDGGEPQREP